MAQATTPDSVSSLRCIAACCAVLALLPAVAAADATQLPRLVVTAGAGSSVRLFTNADFQQATFAPTFADASLAYLFSSGSTLQHGASLGASVNAARDGSTTEGLEPLRQVVLSPGYVLYTRVADFALSARASLPVVVAPDFTAGFELGFAAAYLWRAGFGVYAELGASVFRGGSSPLGLITLHPMISGELGVHIEYELLP